MAILRLWPGFAAVGLCWFSGHGLLILLGCPPQTLLSAVTALPTGLMTAALCGLLFGPTVGFTPASTMVSALVLIGFSMISIMRTPWKQIFGELGRFCSPLGVRVVLAFAILIAALDLPGVAAPDLAYDDQVYHLAIPRLYRELGRLSFLGDLFPANRPQSFHLFMTWVGMVGDDSAMRVLNWLLPLTTACFLLLIIGRRMNRTAGYCAALAFLLHPQLSWLTRTAYTDLIILYLVLAALFALFELTVHAPDEMRPQLLCLSILAGYAAQVKTSGALPAVFSIGGVAAILHWPGLLSKRDPHPHRTLLWFGLAVILLASPWYIRNWLTVGNPFFPHLGWFFSSRPYLPAFHQIFLDTFQVEMPFASSHELLLESFGMGRDLFSLLRLPWDVTIYGRLHDAGTSLRYFDGQIGFAPLALLPLLLWQAAGTSANLRYRLLFGGCLLSGLVWSLGSHQIRFLLPTIGLASVLIGVTAGFNSSYRRLIIAVLVAGLPTTVAFSVSRNALIAEHTRGQQSADELLRAQLPFMGSYKFINSETASHTRVLPLFEERIYYLHRPFTWMSLIPYPFISALIVSDQADQVRQYLERCEIDLLYLPRTGYRTLLEIIEEPGYKQRVTEFFASPSRRLYADEFGEVWAYR